jgi:hypothetical protein
VRSLLRGVGRSLIQDGSLRKGNVRFRLPQKTDIQPMNPGTDMMCQNRQGAWSATLTTAA